ncbi:hypothetical protein PR048_005438 [Dryococelus australis]|uniref:Secreted protein n=1 Tax=Dryococelus australis TaxID=614101 RepID=A0ABQ9I875_9NEOP|nr:hypothetical protein PR048_005438 [Dryococelus australis]
MSNGRGFRNPMIVWFLRRPLRDCCTVWFTFPAVACLATVHDCAELLASPVFVAGMLDVEPPVVRAATDPPALVTSTAADLDDAPTSH